MHCLVNARLHTNLTALGTLTYVLNPQSFVHPFVRAFRSLVCSFIHSFIHSSIRPFVRSSVHTFVLPSVLPSFRPSVLPSVLPSVIRGPALPSVGSPLASFIRVIRVIRAIRGPFFLPSFRPSFLPSFRPSVLPSFRPSVRPSSVVLLCHPWAGLFPLGRYNRHALPRSAKRPRLQGA